MRTAFRIAVITLAALTLWAAAPGTYRLQLFSCVTNTSCTFTDIKSTLMIRPDGSGQVIFPDDTLWNYFQAGTLKYKVTSITPCPPHPPTFTDCHLIQVVIPQFTAPLFHGTGTSITGNGSYEIETYTCARATPRASGTLCRVIIRGSIFAVVK